MTKTLFIALPSLLLSLGAGCVDEHLPAADDQQEQYLFGLTADEVLAARRVANTDMSDAEWLDAHRGEFDCARYGSLCSEVGSEAAYQVIETGYLLAIDGADRDAIRLAQNKAIADALAARPVVAERNTRAATTGFFYGGSNSHRLKVVARAAEMWPSLELRASGECVTQRNSFGWLPAASDSITGTMTATFAGLPVILVAPPPLLNQNTLTFNPVQHDANNLSVSVTCTAVEEGWTATGTVTIGI